MARSRHNGPEEPEEVHSITTAHGAHSQDVDARMKRYAFQMGLRIVCLIVAVLVDGWLRWVAVAGVAILPWVAVVLANGSDRAEVRGADYLPEQTPPQLGAGPAEDAGAQTRTSGTEQAGDAGSPGPDAQDADDVPGAEDDVIEGEFRPGHLHDDHEDESGGRRPGGEER
ncbi:DUF3099 domain-containing protein [Rothia halotolerans]|uniref:DUF3099 domain-containing protein n=1 Tax=Rothia halotolerans TaxID=405770 RepID=UPI00192D68C6|nr:DUF3099 domain-containing protein [Rothia halotolerans]